MNESSTGIFQVQVCFGTLVQPYFQQGKHLIFTICLSPCPIQHMTVLKHDMYILSQHEHFLSIQCQNNNILCAPYTSTFAPENSLI